VKVVVAMQMVVQDLRAMHVLCRAHLAHRTKGVQGAHEEQRARMQRFRVTARRKKTGWDR
jgi:hypothetical protein